MMNSGTNELLQNLDMEMQLLKKKREVIEQQMMCGQRMQLQNEYKQGPSNVSYGAQYGTHTPYKTVHLGKRQNITPWQNEPLTKIGRTDYQGEKSWIEQNQSSYSPRRFHQYKNNKYQNNKFVPTKVEKNKPKQVNKLNTYPMPLRKTLVAETKNIKRPNDSIYAKDILHPDKVPTEKMTGRLELALGMILKELRKEYWSVNLVKRFFDLSHTKRELKFTIRERLRDLLLGKPVPHFGTIHTMYRKHYPIETDAELINTISQNNNLRDRSKKNYLVFKPSEEPQEFVENNFKNIIYNKLRDMFKELEVIYKNKNEEEMMKCDAFNDIYIMRDSNDPPPSAEATKSERDSRPPIDINKPYKDMSISEKLYYCEKQVNEIVNAHLPSLLVSCTEDISNLLCDQESTKLLKGCLVTKMNPKFKGLFLKKTNANVAERKLETAAIKGKYYAKVSCHPHLPSREEMQPFLYSFSPCAVKKPKNSSDIILVLFNTKEQREALLAANGTVLHDIYHLNIVAAEAAPTPATTQQSANKDNKDLTQGTESENDNEVTKADNKETTEQQTVLEAVGENNEDQASSDKVTALSNKDIEQDNENLTHNQDSQMGNEVIKPDNKNSDPSNDKDTEIDKTNIEQEPSNNKDLETSNEDNGANTSIDYGQIINSDLDEQIDDLLTSISKSNAENKVDEVCGNEAMLDSQVTADSKIDQIPTVDLDDDDSKNGSNEELELKINEDVTTDNDATMTGHVSTAEEDSAMVIEDAKETVGDNPAAVEGSESTTSVKEEAKNETAGTVRTSTRIATRRSSRLVNN